MEKLILYIIYFIKNNNAVESKMYYNIAEGGKSGNSYAGKSQEEMDIIKTKISESRKGMLSGKENPMYGKTHTNEVRKKLSELIIGENNPMYGKSGTKSPVYKGIIYQYDKDWNLIN